MNSLLYARAQMGLSLAFHMIFAAAGVALPVIMVIADALWQRTGDRDYLEFSKRMAKGTAILFAVGAVSGTVLSFELGLLWPSFMGTFGEVVGLPFALEGFAFFTEAIFLGIYLYGRDKLPPRLHLLSGALVALSGGLSAFFVILVNACMNDPVGFTMVGGRPTDIDPVAAMFSPPWKHETLHGILACYQATAFVMTGIHALVLLRHPKSTLFRKAFAVTLAVAGVTAVAQPFVGHFAAVEVGAGQPAKLAAMEAHFETSARAPLLVGGLPDVERGEVDYAIEIPGGLSMLLHFDPDAVVPGLDQVPRDEWPPVAATHLSFQVMVGAGTAMALLAVVAAVLAWRRRGIPDQRPFLWATILASPLGIVAMEAGWLVTEFGRQPWIVRGAMRTRDAVTPFPHLAAPFWMFMAVYVFLGVVVTYLLVRQLRAAPLGVTGARGEPGVLGGGASDAP
ncbi:cytochrome D ubiquinol oxidase subunit I [Sorangium cellulosum]|uniref:Cytochrome D ubiquinol oxidase subunit I n=1 Tax=Sorangium cellulosum TaxID=56 RepID=A0A2L0EPX3_SORCE|nr:cytochrome ubiquinol oxidase subunit I [Sorangium cellulosum]AUX41363.1 cytochrome D ubiquinol oxidase subunit I [Sorangium cellulosum]